MIQLTKENLKEYIETSMIPTIIDFYADWCGPCKMIAPIFDSMSKDYAGKVNFVKLNVEEQREVAAMFNVMSIPTLIIIKNKTIYFEQHGFMSKDELKANLDETLNLIK
jgi:thioredoxin 1